MRKEGREIAAGTFFWKGKGESDYTEIGEVQSGSIEQTVETKQTHDRSSTIKKVVAVAVTSIGAKLKFTTRKLDKYVVAKHMLGSESTEDFTTGDTLPDGSVATADVTLPVIKAGTNPLIEGSFKYISDEDGDEKGVIICDDVVLTPTGGRDLISDDWADIAFEGDILADDEGVLYAEHTISLT